MSTTAQAKAARRKARQDRRYGATKGSIGPKFIRQKTKKKGV